MTSRLSRAQIAADLETWAQLIRNSRHSTAYMERSAASRAVEIMPAASDVTPQGAPFRVRGESEPRRTERPRRTIPR